jgi:hypothetical protein
MNHFQGPEGGGERVAVVQEKGAWERRKKGEQARGGDDDLGDSAGVGAGGEQSFPGAFGGTRAEDPIEQIDVGAVHADGSAAQARKLGGVAGVVGVDVRQ